MLIELSITGSLIKKSLIFAFTDVEEGFMPWLMKEVKKEMGYMIESKELLMGKRH